MKRKSQKPIKRRKVQSKSHARRIKIRKRAKRRIRVRRATARSRKPKRIRLKRTVVLSPQELNAKVRAFRVLRQVRRGIATLTKAARQERIKPDIVLRYVGEALYRSGPGKPWKARKSDRLSAPMPILTPQGRTTVVVRGSRERKLLHQYELALRKWRAAEHGAAQELLTFKGQTVAGHRLITDTDLLIHLEEADQLDFDELYVAPRGRS